MERVIGYAPTQTRWQRVRLLLHHTRKKFGAGAAVSDDPRKSECTHSSYVLHNGREDRLIAHPPV